MHHVSFRSIARLRKVHDRSLPQIERRLERAGDDLLLLRRVAPARGVVLRGNHAGKLVEESPHMRSECCGEFLERALYLIAERRGRERFEKRPAEVQRTELREGQSGGESFER